MAAGDTGEANRAAEAGGPGVSLTEPAPADPKATFLKPGRTRTGRLLRRTIGGPGNPVFDGLVGIRRIGMLLRDRAWRRRERRRPRPHPRDGYLAIPGYGFPVLGVVDDRATPHSVHARTLGILVDALESAGIDYFALPRGNGWFDIGVSDRARPRALAALREAAQSSPLVVRGDRFKRWQPAQSAEFIVDEDYRGATLLQVASPSVRADGGARIGLAGAVRIHFWKPLPEGVLGAPRRNRYATYLQRGTQEHPTRIHATGVSMRTFEELAAVHVDDLPFPIDIVYTWVDDQDPVWRERMLAARGDAAARHTVNAIDDSRFRNFDELRYSLRSVAAYAPWVNHVWIVTDRQVPEWLAAAAPGVTVVFHDQIWADRTMLPVFNSHAIEASLHRIEGLAEHYLYLNDDMLFGAPVRPQQFFTPGGLALFHPSPEQIGLGVQTLREGAAQTAAKNDRRILEQATGAVQTQRLKHVPYVQLRSVAEHLEREFPQEYQRTAAATFRSPTDISAISLQTWYAYRTGRAAPSELLYRYIDLVDSASLGLMESMLDGERFEAFCVNQSEKPSIDPAEIRDRLVRFLDAYFPFASPWEA